MAFLKFRLYIIGKLSKYFDFKKSKFSLSEKKYSLAEKLFPFGKKYFVSEKNICFSTKKYFLSKKVFPFRIISYLVSPSDFSADTNYPCGKAEIQYL